MAKEIIHAFRGGKEIPHAATTESVVDGNGIQLVEILKRVGTGNAYLQYMAYYGIPNFLTDKNQLILPRYSAVIYKNRAYRQTTNIDLPLDIPVQEDLSELKVVVFDTTSKKVSIKVLDNYTDADIIIGWFNYSAKSKFAEKSLFLTFDYRINGINENEKTAIPFLKFSVDGALPNFNLVTNALEFPKLASVSYLGVEYALAGNWHEKKTYNIPTDGSTLKCIAFNIYDKKLVIKQHSSVNRYTEYILGWFVYEPHLLKTNYLPFQYTINGLDKNKGISDDINSRNPFYFLPYLRLQGHFFLTANSVHAAPPLYPSQTIADIDFCARMGIKAIEANCHETATKGKYIVMHGDDDCIGVQMMLKKDVYEANPSAYPYAVYNKNQDAYFNFDPSKPKDRTNGHIPSTPYDELRNNYFNRSKYPKYRTPITDMEEFLRECKTHDVLPVITYRNDEQLRIIKEIMGDFYIIRHSERVDNSMHIFWTGSKLTAESALKICNNFGKPFVLGYGTAAALSNTPEELEDIISTLHKNGYFIIFDGNYYTEVQNTKLKAYAFDGQLSGWDVAPFENGNICNLCGDLDFSDYTTNGTVSNCTLKLAEGNTITPKNAIDKYNLSKAILKIRFNGKLTLNFDGKSDNDFILNGASGTFESDGSREMIFSSAFIDSTPTFQITSVGASEIVSINFSASKV